MPSLRSYSVAFVMGVFGSLPPIPAQEYSQAWEDMSVIRATSSQGGQGTCFIVREASPSLKAITADHVALFINSRR